MWHIIKLIMIILSIVMMLISAFFVKDIYAEVSNGIMAILLTQYELGGGNK